MAWNDRIREAAYTSPSGERIIFGYENVSRKIDKKTTGFDFPDADGTFVQDLANGVSNWLGSKGILADYFVNLAENIQNEVIARSEFEEV